MDLEKIKAGNSRESAMLTRLASIVLRELTCPAELKLLLPGFLGTLQSGAGAVELLSKVATQCVWADGRPWARGVERALARALGPDRATYHVCNNDSVSPSFLSNSVFSANFVWHRCSRAPSSPPLPRDARSFATARAPCAPDRASSTHLKRYSSIASPVRGMVF